MMSLYLLASPTVRSCKHSTTASHTVLIKVNCTIPLCRSVDRVLTHLPSFSHEPIGRYTTKSVMHGQCDTRPTVTFPAKECDACFGRHQTILLGDRDTGVSSCLRPLPDGIWRHINGSWEGYDIICLALLWGLHINNATASRGH